MIEFIKDYTVQDTERKTYLAGQRVTLSQASETHFIRRGAAVLIADNEPVEVKKNPIESVGLSQPAPVLQNQTVKPSRKPRRSSR